MDRNEFSKCVDQLFLMKQDTKEPFPITQREMDFLTARGAVSCKHDLVKAGVTVRVVKSDALPPGVILPVYVQPEFKPTEKDNEH